MLVTYRIHMQIVADLLTATYESGQDGIKITQLLKKANLSHSRFTKFIENLTGAGMINKIKYDGKKYFCNYTKRHPIPGVIRKVCKFCGIFWTRSLKTLFQISIEKLVFF